MTRLNAANNAQTRLVGDITAEATSFYVEDGGVFPVAPFVVTIDDEIMRIGTILGNLLSGISRGQEGTTAAAHIADDPDTWVELRWTAGMYAGLVDQEALAAHAASVATHGGISHKNILHNWDLRNLVNQRGQSSYSTAYAYTIDRWKNANSGILTINSGYVRLQADALNSYITQFIENYASLAGLTLTATVLAKKPAGNNITIRLYDGVTYSSAVVVATGDWQYVAVTKTMSAAPSICEMLIYADNISGTGYIDLKAAKLELGSVSTLANDPPADLGEQLPLCQRHCIRLSGQYRHVGIGIAVNTTLAFFQIPIPVSLRATPTVGYSGLYLASANHSGGSSIAVASFSDINLNQNMISGNINVASGLTSGETVILQIRDSSGYVELSADL